MRTIPWLLLLAALSFPSWALTRQVDLDQPGAIERIQRDNPAHYRAIQHILSEAPAMQPRALTGWIRTAYDPGASTVLLIKTSYPPRARLEFSLDDTRYVAVVTLRNVEPARLPVEVPAH